MESAAQKAGKMTNVAGWGILVGDDHLLCQLFYTECAATIACMHTPNAKPVRVRLILEPREDNVKRLRPRLVVSNEEEL